MTQKKKVRFAIIGCGLMGREFASVVGRWCHGLEDVPEPELVGVCNRTIEKTRWFTEHFDTIRYVTADYRELLDKQDIDAVYCAVPHHLHQQMYIDIIEAGKHLLGEKPFGIDAKANKAIVEAANAHPEVVVRCASEFPFYPACQMLYRWIRDGKFGKVLEVRAGFNHSSDMDLSKPINWKRQIEMNGEYGCVGDLGLHTQHIPLRVGWYPKSVYGVFSNIAKERPDGKGGMAPCETWDNATLICNVEQPDGWTFPMYLETKRMQPGATNEWYLEVLGLEQSARFTTEDPNAFYFTEAMGKNQAWCRVNIGYQPQFRTITGDIFEFGFPDSMLQMWICFLKELDGQEVEFGLPTPEETRKYHAIATAGLRSNKEGRAIRIE